LHSLDKNIFKASACDNSEAADQTISCDQLRSVVRGLEPVLNLHVLSGLVVCSAWSGTFYVTAYFVSAKFFGGIESPAAL